MRDQLEPRKTLSGFKPEKPFFAGVDSDGCVFDTMELKHKECLCPNFIKFFNLQSVSRYARQTWEFVNLYSKHRGVNRFVGLSVSMKLLAKRREVMSEITDFPDMQPLEDWINNETRLGNPALEDYIKDNYHPLLKKILEWSKKVNQDIEEMVVGIKPFSHARKALEKIHKHADIMVVSQTPLEALHREWDENKLNHLVKVIIGQEFGSKTESLALAAKGKYPDNHILMIGDAPGDQKAAQANNLLFFPILPGREEESWVRLHHEALDKFINGSYDKVYQEERLREFHSLLPDTPPWQKE